MWNPTCYGNPGKVSDTSVRLRAPADNGGVHNNSGVPNHAFALHRRRRNLQRPDDHRNRPDQGRAHLLSGRRRNTRVATSDFADHADAIEQSAPDLVGVILLISSTGAPRDEIITAADVTEIEKAMLAVEMRTPPTQCNFQPILAQNPPARCAGGPDRSGPLLGRLRERARRLDGQPRWRSFREDFTDARLGARQLLPTLPDGPAPGKAFFAHRSGISGPALPEAMSRESCT